MVKPVAEALALSTVDPASTEGPYMATPPGSASRALHSLISSLVLHQQQGGYTVTESWNEKTGLPLDSPQFAALHAQSMNLIPAVIGEIQTLPQSDRPVFEAYVNDWWAALVIPHADWSKSEAHRILDPPALPVLAALASAVEAQQTNEAPDWKHTERMLRAGIQALMDVVIEAQDIPRTARQELLHDLAHIIWVIDNINTLGLHAVGSATETLTGTLIAKSATAPRVKTYKKLAIAATAILAITATATSDVNSIVDNVRGIFGNDSESETKRVANEEIDQLVVKMYQTCSPQQTLPPPRPEETPLNAQDR